MLRTHSTSRTASPGRSLDSARSDPSPHSDTAAPTQGAPRDLPQGALVGSLAKVKNAFAAVKIGAVATARWRDTVAEASEAEEAPGALGKSSSGADGTSRPQDDKHQTDATGRTGPDPAGPSPAADRATQRPDPGESLDAFKARLEQMLDKGQATQAADLFVERALGPAATPQDCADLVATVRNGSPWRRSLRVAFLSQCSAGTDDRESGASPSASDRQVAVAADFIRALARSGSQLLSSEGQGLARDRGRVVLAAAFEVLASHSPRVVVACCAESDVVAPWIRALVAGFPRGSSASLCPLPDHRPLAGLLQALDVHSMAYPVVKAALMAHIPGASGGSGDQGLPSASASRHLMEVIDRMREPLEDLGLRIYREGWGLNATALFLRAASDGLNDITAKMYETPVTTGEVWCSAMKSHMQLVDWMRARMVFSAIDRALDSMANPGPCPTSGSARGLMRPADIFNGKTDPERQLQALGAWFQAVIAELRPDQFISERQALVDALGRPGRPGAASTGIGQRGPASASTAAAARPTSVAGHPLVEFYAAYRKALWRVGKQLSDLRGAGVPTAVRQLCEPLLVARLASHAILLRREAEWLAQHQDRLPIEPEDIRRTSAVHRGIAAELRLAIADLDRWPAWVGEAVEGMPKRASGPGSAVSEAGPAALAPAGGSATRDK